MPVSSLIVSTQEHQAGRVAEAIDQMPSTSVCRVIQNDIVVLTETRDQQEDQRLWEQMKQIPGVLAVDLIYHNFEDVEEINE